jgi:hypothetical protein
VGLGTSARSRGHPCYNRGTSALCVQAGAAGEARAGAALSQRSAQRGPEPNIRRTMTGWTRAG